MSQAGAVSIGAQTFNGAKTFDDGAVIAATQALAVTSGCSMDTDVDCPASSTSGGSVQFKEDSDLGASTFTLTLGASNLSSDVTCTIDTSGRIPDSCVGDGSDGGGASPLTTKGDIYTRSASADDRLPVGTNGQVVGADSTQTTGLKYYDVVNMTISSEIGRASCRERVYVLV